MLLFILLLFLPSQLGFHFWPSWSFISGVRIDYLSPTLYLTDLIIFLLIFIHRPKIKIPVLIIIFLTLNIFFSLSPLVSLFKWLRILEYYLLFLSLYKIHDTRYIIQKALPWAVIWVSFLAWLQFILQSSIGGLWYWLGERTFNVATPGLAKISLLGHETLRAYATFPHPNALAGFLLISFLILLCHSERSRGIPYLSKSAIFIALLTIPITFSRTAIILELFLLVFFFVPKFKKILISFSLLILTTYFTTHYSQLSTSFTDRIWLLQKSFLAIQKFPITGLGIGTFPVFQPELTAPSFSLQFQPVHNIFLLLISELGLPFSIYMLYKLSRSIIHNSSFIIPISVIVATGLVDHYWLTLPQNTLLLVVLIAFIAVQSANAKSAI